MGVEEKAVLLELLDDVVQRSPHTSICVLIPLYMCPHTPVYMCPHTPVIFWHYCTRTKIPWIHAEMARFSASWFCAPDFSWWRMSVAILFFLEETAIREMITCSISPL
jgi:hypothetical protein